MFKDEGIEDLKIRIPKYEYDPQKVEYQTFEVPQRSSEDPPNLSQDDNVQEKAADLEHIALDMLKLLPEYGRNQGQERKAHVKTKVSKIYNL